MPEFTKEVRKRLVEQRDHHAMQAEYYTLGGQGKKKMAEIQAQKAAELDAAISHIDALEARVKALESVLYPLVVEGVRAEVREDAPEYVNDEVYEGARALPQCVPCAGTGATDKKHYEDQPIPEELLCAVCDGFGFTMHAKEAPDAAR